MRRAWCASDLLSLAATEAALAADMATVIVADLRGGITPAEQDLQRLSEAAERLRDMRGAASVQ